MDANQAVQFLESLIGQTIRVHATDTRIFVGTFKCTDAVGDPIKNRIKRIKKAKRILKKRIKVYEVKKQKSLIEGSIGPQHHPREHV